jgi:hypothetical protein
MKCGNVSQVGAIVIAAPSGNCLDAPQAFEPLSGSRGHSSSRLPGTASA